MQNGCRVRDLWRLLAVAGAVGAASAALASDPVKAQDQKVTKTGVPTMTGAQAPVVAPKAEPVKAGQFNKGIEPVYIAPPGQLRGPGNDTCATATAMTIGSTVVADTSTATPDAEAAICAGAGQTSPGVWFSFVGDGTSVTATTCNAATTFDTVLRIFDGSGGCGALACSAYNDDNCGAFIFRSTTPPFQTVAGTTYYILVTGFGSGSGQAELTLTSLGGPPANDECSGAISLTCNSSVTADNTLATTNPADPAFSCHVNGVPTQGFGSIWYNFVATDTSARLTTCSSVFPADDSLLAVYDSCGGFEMACNDDFCGFISRLDVQGLTVGTTYTVQLAAWSTSDQGAYTLELTCPVPPIPPGDECPTAIAIPGLPFNTSGDTGSFTPDGGLPFCGTGDASNSVWYSVTGTGTPIRATTCNGTTYDSALSVYTGDCGALSCVVSNDDFCGLQSQVIFGTTAGQTYYIVVRGFSTAFGSYVLDVEALVPPVNDECSGAIALSCNSSTTVDNTAATTNPGDPLFNCHFSGPNQGFGTMWYSFVATETSARLQTCGSVFPADDSLLAVYDACGGTELACNDDFCNLNSRVDVQGLTVGNTYLVQVAAWSASDQGVYNLELICPVPPIPPGDECPTAFPIGSLPFNASGDTSGFNPDGGLPACGAGAASNSVWYSFVGTGNNTRVDLCNGTTYDSAIAVFTGPDCSSLSCVASNDDACGLQSQLTFLSNAGQQYFIVIRGFGSSFGSYVMDVTDLGPPGPGDVCATAIAATVPSTVTGDTGAYTPDAVPACGPNGGSPTVWYSVVGSGNRYRATLCNGTTYDSAVSVYTGPDCSALTCVASDDDFCGFAAASQVTWDTIAGQTYYVMVGGFGTSSGFYSMDLLDIGPPCEITPPGGALDENEPDCGLPVDSVNGGCNSAPPVFINVACGQPVVGSTAFDASIGFRDTDWYLFELAQDDTVTITVNTEFNGIFGFVGDAAGPIAYPGDPASWCPLINQINPFALTADDCVGTQVSAFLTAGTWVIFVSNPFTNVTCGGQDDYLMVVETATPCSGGADCNENGTPDADEIAANPALDCFNPAVLLNPHVTGGPDGALDVCQCTGNFNRDGAVNSSDISSFLTGWLSAVQNGNTNGDIDCSGSTNSSDISSYLTRWLANVQGTVSYDGCP